MNSSKVTDRLAVYMLDVGHGDCSFIVPPGEEDNPILFDCADPYVASRFVANHGITRLAAVIASHLDVDHIRGVLPFLKNFFDSGGRVDRLLIGYDRVPESGGDVTIRALIEQVLKWIATPPHDGFVVDDPRRFSDQPLRILGRDDWSIEAVLPTYAARLKAGLGGARDTNACSVVLRVDRGGRALLIGGDAPLAAWQEVEPDVLLASLVRTPHHGGGIIGGSETWPDVEKLYESIGAKTAVVSVGSNNGYAHPLTFHVDAMRPRHRRVMCTQLTPRCAEDLQGLRDHALGNAAGVEFPYRHRAQKGHPKKRPAAEVPCAGSIVAWIPPTGPIEVWPGELQHRAVVDRTATPMCKPRDA